MRFFFHSGAKVLAVPGMLPVYSGRDAPGPYPEWGETPPPVFAQVFILKVVKVLCFDTLLQVLILKAVSVGWFRVLQQTKKRLLDLPSQPQDFWMHL
jgi:hypothetical protein